MAEKEKEKRKHSILYKMAMIRWTYTWLIIIALSFFIIEFDWVSRLHIHMSPILNKSINGIIIGVLSTIQFIWLWAIRKFNKYLKGLIVD